MCDKTSRLSLALANINRNATSFLMQKYVYVYAHDEKEVGRKTRRQHNEVLICLPISFLCAPWNFSRRSVGRAISPRLFCRSRQPSWPAQHTNSHLTGGGSARHSRDFRLSFTITNSAVPTSRRTNISAQQHAYITRKKGSRRRWRRKPEANEWRPLPADLYHDPFDLPPHF